jgi:hypothetical protein
MQTRCQGKAVTKRVLGKNGEGQCECGHRRGLPLRAVQTGECLSLRVIAGGAPSHHRALQPLTERLVHGPPRSDAEAWVPRQFRGAGEVEA